ncbi:MAG: prolyl oligopeptidase family serine peptidase [Bryobacterales bacterium]
MAHFFWMIALAAVVFAAETPPGLLTLQDEPLIQSPDRNWKSLGIGTGEIRKLNRVSRADGVESWNIGYSSDGLGIAGFMAQPIVEFDDDGKPKATYPAVIICHGSAQGVTPAYREIAMEFARRGYVAAASAYRGQRGLAGHSEGAREYAKGETLDVLQLAQLVRKLEYVDSQRMAIWGQAEGGSIAAQIIGRSNIFRAAVLVAPALFAGTPQYRYAGLRRLASLTAQISGKQMTDGMMVRELRARDAFLNIPKIKTSTLIIAPESDPGAQELSLWIGALRGAGVEHRVLPFPGMFPEFMTAADNGLRPPNWAESREAAWANTFSWIESYVPSEPGPAPAQ